MRKIMTFDGFSSQCPFFYSHEDSENNGYDCKHPDVEWLDKNEKIHRCHVFTCPLITEADEENFNDPDVDADGFEWHEHTQFCVVEESTA